MQPTVTRNVTEQEVRSAAEALSLSYIQYHGHFDGWEIGQMTEDLHFKEWKYGKDSALLAAKGDRVLVQPPPTGWYVYRGETTIAAIDRSGDRDFVRVMVIPGSKVTLIREEDR